MSKAASPYLKLQYFDVTAVGVVPGNGYKLYTYAAGTTTPQATYTTPAGATPNANPIILDSAGRCTLYISAVAYKYVLKTAADVEVWTVDNVMDLGQLETDRLADASNVAYGDALVAYKHIDGISALTARTVHARWQDEAVDVVDYGADPTGVADSTAAIQLAIDNLPTRSSLKYGAIFFPAGDYKVTGTITLTAARGVRLFGISEIATRFVVSNAGAAFDLFRIWGCRDCLFENFGVVSSPTHKLDSAFVLETKTGTTSTKNVFRNIDIQGTGNTGIQYGWKGLVGSGGNNNNDGHIFYNCQVHNWVVAAWEQGTGNQAKSWIFYSSSGAGDQAFSQYVWHGQALSIKVIGCQGGGVLTSVFQSEDVNNPGVDVDYCGFENCGRLFKTGGSNNPYAVRIANTRFSPVSYLNVDGKAVIYLFLGPFVMENCYFERDSVTGAQSWQIGGGTIDPAGEPADRPRAVIVVRHNMIASTLANPFIQSGAGSSPIVQYGNSIDRGPGPGTAFNDSVMLPNFIFSGQAVASQAAANNNSFPIVAGLVTVSGNTQMNTANLNGLDFGTEIEIVFSGTPRVAHNAVPPSTQFAAFLLRGGEDFLATAGAVLRLRLWNGGAGVAYWIEVSRCQTIWTTPAGTGAGLAYTGGRLNVNTTAVGNVGAGEDNLITYSLPAAAMAVDGQGIRITAWGTAANTADAKTLKVYFGATVLVSLALTINQVGYWRVTAEVIRTAAATQEAIGQILQGGAATLIAVLQSTPGETLANAITVKCTGEAVSNNDIVQEGLVVEYIR